MLLTLEGVGMNLSWHFTATVVCYMSSFEEMILDERVSKLLAEFNLQGQAIIHPPPCHNTDVGKNKQTIYIIASQPLHIGTAQNASIYLFKNVP